MALRTLDADEKGLSIVETPGGKQELNIVSEPGLYKLIGRSRKPEARRFDRFVRHEILPAIRRTGRFEIEPNATRINTHCCVITGSAGRCAPSKTRAEASSIFGKSPLSLLAGR